jgi:hypothetical protein
MEESVVYLTLYVPAFFAYNQSHLPFLVACILSVFSWKEERMFTAKKKQQQGTELCFETFGSLVIKTWGYLKNYYILNYLLIKWFITVRVIAYSRSKMTWMEFWGLYNLYRPLPGWGPQIGHNCHVYIFLRTKHVGFPLLVRRLYMAWTTRIKLLNNKIIVWRQ